MNKEENENEEIDVDTISGVLPKRLSEMNIVTKIKPIPVDSSFFIFSNKNKLVEILNYLDSNSLNFLN